MDPLINDDVEGAERREWTRPTLTRIAAEMTANGGNSRVDSGNGTS